MTIKIKSDRVLEAAKRCPAAKEVLEILFPTVFESEAERASESVQGSSWTQPKFQRGDIVRYAGGDFHWLELTVGGIVGKVIAAYGEFPHWRLPTGTVGVEFSRKVTNGHDCDGRGRRGFCRYVPERCLVLIYRSPQEA